MLVSAAPNRTNLPSLQTCVQLLAIVVLTLNLTHAFSDQENIAYRAKSLEKVDSDGSIWDKELFVAVESEECRTEGLRLIGIDDGEIAALEVGHVKRRAMRLRMIAINIYEKMAAAKANDPFKGQEKRLRLIGSHSGGNIAVAKDERAARRATMLKRLDTNRDGRISAAEADKQRAAVEEARTERMRAAAKK